MLETPVSAATETSQDRPMSAEDLVIENARLRAALRESERLAGLGRLLCGLAHELNNPLAVVMGRAEMLADDESQPAAVRSSAGRIVDAAARCGRLLRGCQNLARHRPLTATPVRLDELVHNTLELLAYPLRRLGVALELDLDASLPQLQGDADQLTQTLASLILDALQAMQCCRAPKLCISTGRTAGQPAGQWLRVADNGPAVPAHLHEGFFMDAGIASRSDAPGHGLGLALARDTALAHGGELVLEDMGSATMGASLLLTLPGTAAH